MFEGDGGHGPRYGMVKITRKCPKAPCRGRISTVVDKAGVVESRCPVCGEDVKLEIPAELGPRGESDATREAMAGTARPKGAGGAAGVVKRCAACPGREFFIRKDFPQKLGMLLVVIFGMIATYFYAEQRVGLTFATLGSLVVIDAIIYFFVGKVTVCYRCRAEYRGVAYNPDHAGFDLATSEKY
jgi:rRNA maturation protein Nop10